MKKYIIIYIIGFVFLFDSNYINKLSKISYQIPDENYS